MQTPEEETKVKNDIILLGSLRNDIVEASTTLTVIKKDVDEQDNVLDEKRQEIAILEQKKVDEMSELEREKAELIQSNIQLENAKKRSKEELSVIDRQKRDAMSELRRLNEWNFDAKNELDKYKDILSELLFMEKEKRNYLLDYSKKAEEEIENYRITLIDIKLEHDNLIAILDKNTRELVKIQNELLSLNEEKENIEESMAETIREKKRIEVDLDIYSKRIAKEYKKTFPKKIIKLNKK